MRSLFTRTNFLSVVLLITHLSIVYAVPPDSGILLNQQQQIENILPDSLSESDENAKNIKKQDKKSVFSENGLKIILEDINFIGTGNEVTQSELSLLTNDFIGKELYFFELNALIGRITDYLIEKKGFMLARAYLPPQDLSSKILSVGIITGLIQDKSLIEVKSPSRIRSSVLQGISNRSLPTGVPLNMNKMERTLLLMNDINGLSARGFLEKGSEPGTTQLIIQVEEGSLFAGSVSTDNYGDRYTGEWRIGIHGDIRDSFGLGDDFSLSYTGAKDMNQGRFSYAMLIPYTDLFWDLSYSALEYRVGKELYDLKVRGVAQTYGTLVRYPYLRTRKASLWAGAGFEYLILKDEANYIDTANRKLLVGNVYFSGNFIDAMFGGGLTSFNFGVKSGELDLSSLDGAEERDALGPRKNGSFIRMYYALARLQRVTRDVSLFGSLRGQFSDGNLDSSQKFILGGPTGVRAYPVGEASGDEGHAFTFETRYDVPRKFSFGVFQLLTFADLGWVQLHNNPWDGAVINVDNKNDYWIYGAGVGINLTLSDFYSVRFAYSRRIEDNPGRNMNGMDSDNQKDYDRFWLQAVMWM